MTQRTALYAESLTRVVDPEYEQQIVNDPSLE